MMDHEQSPQLTPADNLFGVAFTSANPLEGCSYDTAKKTTRSQDDSSTSQDIIQRPSTPPPPPLATSSPFNPFSSPPVTLLVGGLSSPSTETDRIPFYVHADLLTSVSPFFAAAFNTKSAHTVTNAGWSFSESHTRIMKLPEERPADVAYLTQWIYWRSLYMPTVQKSQGSGILPAGGLWHGGIDPRVQRYQEYAEAKKLLKTTLGEQVKGVKQLKRPEPPMFGPLVRLYVLANKFGVRDLEVELCVRVREVGKSGKCVPERDDVALLWENAVEDGDEGLKNVVLDMYANLGVRSFRHVFWPPCHVDEGGEAGEWHQDFLADLLVRMYDRVDKLKKGRKEEGEGMGMGGKSVSLAV